MKFIRHKINEAYFGKIPKTGDEGFKKQSNMSKIIASGIAALNAKIPELTEIANKSIEKVFGDMTEQLIRTSASSNINLNKQKDLIAVDYASALPFFLAYNLNPSDEEWENGTWKGKYISDIKYVPGEGFDIYLYVADNRLSPYEIWPQAEGDSAIILGKGVGDFLDKLDTLDRTITKQFNGIPVNIKLVRLATSLSSYSGAHYLWSCKNDLEKVKEKYNLQCYCKTNTNFPAGLDSVVITDDVDLDKLYKLLLKFDELQVDTIIKHLYICGKKELPSLSELPPPPFKANEIIFAYYPKDNQDYTVNLYEIGNYNKLLTKNYNSKITFYLNSFEDDDIARLTNNVITLGCVQSARENYSLDTIYKRNIKVNAVSFNPYTKLFLIPGPLKANFEKFILTQIKKKEEELSES